MELRSDGVSFSESDSAGALEELDRGLRSTKIGEQCGVIGKVPYLLERYPFPLFINSTVLKLAEVFKQGNNNLLRRCIVKVAERSEKHLDKIVSVDEVLKRVFSVSHSNDPEARALTLELLGYLAPILAEKKSVHHLLSNSFESRDYEELLAAIQASQYYAKYSPDFSHGILEKAEDVLLSIQSPSKTKVELIPIFRFMHNHASDVKRVMRLCKEHLLSDCPDDELRELVLNVLTELTAKSQLILADQLALLLEELMNPSRNMRFVALKNLKILAAKSPHLWAVQTVKELGDFCFDCKNLHMQNWALKVFVELTRSRTCAVWLRGYASEFLPLCSALTVHHIIPISVNAVTILINISEAVSSDEKDLFDYLARTETDALLFMMAKINRNGANTRILKEVLLLVIAVVEKDLENGMGLVKSLISFVESSQRPGNSDEKEVLLALASLAERCPQLYPDLYRWAYEKLEKSAQISVELGSFLIPPRNALSPGHSCGEELVKKLESECPWKMYQFGRKAMRNGWPEIGLKLLELIGEKTVKSKFRHYFNAMVNLCKADCILRDIQKESMTHCLNEACCLCLEASQQFKLVASLGKKSSPWFHAEWIGCRLAFLEASRELTAVWKSLKLYPPPASSLIGENRKGQISNMVSQLSKCAMQFRKVGNRYSEFFRSCFDADSHTLDSLSVAQLACSLMDKSLGQLLGSTTWDISFPDERGMNCCNRLTYSFLSSSLNQLQKLPVGLESETAKSAVEQLLDILTNFLRIPLYYPRYFFQVLQQTDIRLKLSPQPQGTNKVLNVIHGQELVVTVEGLTQCRVDGRKPLRTISKVLLNVSLGLTHAREIPVFDKERKAVSELLKRTVEPRNDYFAAKFLISFPQNFQSGFVFVSADVMNAETERIWNSGAFSKLKVNMIGTDLRSGTPGIVAKRKLTE